MLNPLINRTPSHLKVEDQQENCLKHKSISMQLEDNCVTIHPYFKVPDGNLIEFKQLCNVFIEKTKTEKGCLYYGFSFSEEEAHCREGYANAEGLLQHLENISEQFQEVLKIAELTRLEIHGPEAEISKLRKPLQGFKPTYFILDSGFRR